MRRLFACPLRAQSCKWRRAHAFTNGAAAERFDIDGAVEIASRLKSSSQASHGGLSWLRAAGSCTASTRHSLSGVCQCWWLAKPFLPSPCLSAWLGHTGRRSWAALRLRRLLVGGLAAALLMLPVADVVFLACWLLLSGTVCMTAGALRFVRPFVMISCVHHPLWPTKKKKRMNVESASHSFVSTRSGP